MLAKKRCAENRHIVLKNKQQKEGKKKVAGGMGGGINYFNLLLVYRNRKQNEV